MTHKATVIELHFHHVFDCGLKLSSTLSRAYNLKLVLQVVTYIQQVESQNGLLRTSIIGNSYENNSIYMATISSGNSTNKSVIYLECCMHAREWISTATCMFIIEEVRRGVNASIEFQ